MNIPLPLGSLLGWAQSTYAYFRTGVKVEGEARLCESPHGPFFAVGEGPIVGGHDQPQHIDVEARFWNRRGGRVSILDVAGVRILSREQALTVAPWFKFTPLTLEEGGQPEVSNFVLVPRDAPDSRVEVSLGEVLVVEFRPSRGSERFARPSLRVPLGGKDSA